MPFIWVYCILSQNYWLLTFEKRKLLEKSVTYSSGRCKLMLSTATQGPLSISLGLISSFSSTRSWIWTTSEVPEELLKSGELDLKLKSDNACRSCSRFWWSLLDTWWANSFKSKQRTWSMTTHFYGTTIIVTIISIIVIAVIILSSIVFLLTLKY